METPQQTRARRLAYIAGYSTGCPVIVCDDAADIARKSHRTAQPSLGALLNALDRDCDRYHARKEN